MGISSNNEQLDKITGASENDVIIEEAVETRSKNITGPGTMGRPFNASRPGDTLNTSKKKFSSVPSDVESPYVSEQEEPDAAIPGPDKQQDAVQTKLEDTVAQGGADAMQNQIFQENTKDPIENGHWQKPVAVPAEDFPISSAGEVTQRIVNSFTGEANDTVGKEETAGDEDLGNLGPNKLSKRRKLMVLSH